MLSVKEHNRSDRVAEQLRRELALLIQTESGDPRFKSFTVSSVRVSRDLTQARVYLTSSQGAKASAEGLAAINKAANYFRFLLKDRMLLRIIPQLRFVYDESVDRGARLSALIDKVIREDSERTQKADRDAGE